MKREIFLVTVSCGGGPTIQRLIETRNKTYASRIVAKDVIVVTRPNESEVAVLVEAGIAVEQNK